MSTPRTEDDGENEPQDEPRNRLFLRAIRVFAVLSAAVALYALWSVERVSLDCDLQLAAPVAARPDERIATRALVFCGLDAFSGPRLAMPARVSIALLDRAGRELVKARPRPTALQTFEDSWWLPAGPEGDFLIEANTIVEGVPLSVRRPLRIAKDALPETVVGREAGALQQLALGRVHTLAGPAPDRFLPRVVGGACVPEQRCTLIVWVGAPAAAISLRSSAAVVLRSQSNTGETEGLVRLEIEVHGPDAELTLEARRAGILVAERALRLPISLGEPALIGGGSIQALVVVPRVPADKPFDVLLPPGRSRVGLDLFSAGRWSATATLEHDQDKFSVQAFKLERLSYLLRIQAHADPFSADATGVRFVFLAGPVGQGETSSRGALQDLALLLETPENRAWLAPLDEPGVPRASELWSKELPVYATAELQTSAAFLLAPAEATRALVPQPSSGRPAQLARLGRTKVRMRYGVAAALALSAWLLALSIARRGLLAVDQAQAIMDEARADEGPTADSHDPTRERISARAKVLLMALAVAAAFLAGALLIAAKSLWF